MSGPTGPRPPTYLIGQKFNMLTVLSIDPGRYYDSKNHYAEFKCDCGKVGYIRIDNVKSGRQKSCGCLKVALSAERFQNMRRKATQ